MPIAYCAILASFLLIDAIWLSLVMRPLFEADVPALLADDVRLGVAAGFYAFYCAGILWFAARPALAGGGYRAALLNGAILGFIAYGCYEATNMATLRGWTWRIVVVDVTWGTALTALTAVIGTWAGRATAR